MEGDCNFIITAFVKRGVIRHRLQRDETKKMENKTQKMVEKRRRKNTKCYSG